MANTCIKPIVSTRVAVLQLPRSSFPCIRPSSIRHERPPHDTMYSHAGTSGRSLHHVQSFLLIRITKTPAESGVLYVVKDRKGRSQYVRRPKAPPTSPPLASDFDQCTTRPPTEWGARNSWAPTTAPLPEDFDAVTYTAVTVAPVEDEQVEDQDAMDSTRRSASFSSGPSTRRRSTLPAGWGRGAPSNDSGVDMGTYGEFGEYTKEMQQVFPSSRGFAVSVSKNSPRHHQPTRRNTHSKSLRPKRGAEFDVVKDRILEETPEKTTTISTWRRRVADEAHDDEEDMSVYYLTPRDYEMQVQDFGKGMTSRATSSVQGTQRSIGLSSQQVSSLPAFAVPYALNRLFDRHPGAKVPEAFSIVLLLEIWFLEIHVQHHLPPGFS